MRKKRNSQIEFVFQPRTLKITDEYIARYERISKILDKHPEIVDQVHKDLKKLLKGKKRKGGPGRIGFTSDTILRIVICQIMEKESLRRIAVRIDDSRYLRGFVRIYDGPMIDFTTYSTLKNAIRPKTWKKVNELLTEAAVEEELISGEKLRIDTTAVETNIHWPTDSGLLWDTYRVISRLINTAREIDPEAADNKRLQAKRAKKIHCTIARRSRKKGTVRKEAKELYTKLIWLVDRLLEWVPSVCDSLRVGLAANAYGFMESLVVEGVIEELEHFRSLGLKVLDQARRRILDGEKVPNDEKLFSIFEPHTELLKRGKASKPIEFGHMISIQQVKETFITDYQVFEKKPDDKTLIEPALDRHRNVFGSNPDELSADKGFYESLEKIEELEAEIEVVSIGKKGKRTKEESEREHTEEFRGAQRFRAGVEGSISFLKRILGLWRCMSKGWEHYVATVGATVFVHNLLVLTSL